MNYQAFQDIGVLESGLQVLPYSAAAWQEVRPYWQELERLSPNASIFLSASWVESWLEVFGATLQTEFVICRHDGRIVGACLLVRRLTRRGPFKIRRVYLNTSGEDVGERTYVEYNDLLTAPGYEPYMAEALSGYLRKSAWDEFCLDGMVEGAALKALSGLFPNAQYAAKPVPSWFVDLRAVRHAPFEQSIASKARKEFRQNLRRYGEWGEVRLDAAASTVEALAMLAEMAQLSREHWRAAGGASSFESARFQRFHEVFVRRAFGEGRAQLVRVSAGGRTIGILYNLVEAKSVRFYQSGFYYGEDKRLRPGFLTILLAIQYCIDHGFEEFDLMAGDQPYKREFTKSSRPLLWCTVRRDSVVLPLLDCAADLKRRAGRLLRRAK